MTTRVAIDPNVRVRGNDTFAGLEDVTGPLAVGQEVEVYEAEADIVGLGCVTEIDVDRRLVYLSVDWGSLQDASAAAETTELFVAHISQGASAALALRPTRTTWATVTMRIRDLLQVEQPGIPHHGQLRVVL